MPWRLLGYVPFPVKAPGEVGRSKDHNNHSPFIRLFFLFTLSISVLAFYSAMCICGVDDIMLVVVVPVEYSALLRLGSDAAGWVPMKAFLVVTIMTPVSVLPVIDWIRYHCCNQRRLEPLDMCIDLFIILGEMGGDLMLGATLPNHMAYRTNPKGTKEIQWQV
jgi:hypothetical protein